MTKKVNYYNYNLDSIIKKYLITQKTPTVRKYWTVRREDDLPKNKESFAPSRLCVNFFLNISRNIVVTLSQQLSCYNIKSTIKKYLIVQKVPTLSALFNCFHARITP